MKFIANTNSFIRVIQAVLPAIDKKSKMAGMDRIYITLENSEISIYISTPTHFFIVPCQYQTYGYEGNGTIAFDTTTINAILKAKTFDITISTEDDNIIIRMGSRIAKVKNLAADAELLCAPVGKFTDIMTVSEMDIAEAFINLKLFIDKKELRPMCQHIHINSIYQCMEAMQDTAVLRRYFPSNCFLELTSTAIPIEVTEHLKKVFDKSSENRITISKSDTDYICIKGANFTYYHKSQNITFFDTGSLFDSMRNTNSYCIKIKELLEIIGCYKDIKNKDNKLYIPMMAYNNMLYTYYKCNAVEITDHINVEPMTERISGICKTALDGKLILNFLKVAASLYEDEFYLYIDDKPISSTFFSVRHYDCLILPIRIKETIWNKLQEQIKE